MSGDRAREFVDATVLVYAYDASAGKKHAAAEQLLARLWEAGTGCLSVQVLQEFFVTVTAEVAKRLPAIEAADRIRDFVTWPVFTPGPDDVLRAITLHTQTKIGFWDAMVVHAERFG